MEPASPQSTAAKSRSDRALGLLLFLPVPLVLWLFTRAPLGTLASLGAGTLIMLSHRFYARPFAVARAERRCLWCGGPASYGPRFEVEEPFARTTWRACTAPHARSLGAVLGWAQHRATLLRVGILGTLVVFLVASLLAGVGRLGPLRLDDAVAFFRLGIALTVLPLGFLWPRVAAASGPPRVPFPLHIQALIGTWAVLWLFRLVGLFWLGAGLWHVASRVAGGPAS